VQLDAVAELAVHIALVFKLLRQGQLGGRGCATRRLGLLSCGSQVDDLLLESGCMLPGALQLGVNLLDGMLSCAGSEKSS
jgi:hypothetical protein